MEINGTGFSYDDSLIIRLNRLDDRIREMWQTGQLSPQQLRRIHAQSKIDELYHSNRIEGNALTYGDTVDVVQHDQTIDGKPIKDQREASNLSAALDLVQDLANTSARPLSQGDIRQIHALVLKDIQQDAGEYRKTEVRISGSKHAMPDAFDVPPQMMELSDYLGSITSGQTISAGDSPILCAASAHTWLVQIHPFTDGNGRTARALMNLVLMRLGYHPCIVTEDDRDRYIDAMEYSRDTSDLTPFAELICENIEEHLESTEWLASLTSRIEISATLHAREEYQDWHNAMQYLKSRFKHVIDNINAVPPAGRTRCNFREYGPLSIEKYVTLTDDGNATKTWFFGLELIIRNRRSRYMFFFASAKGSIKRRSSVVLVAAKNTDAGYKSLFNLNREGHTVPDVFQIGFDLESRKFLTAGRSGIRERNPANLVQQFLEQVLERDFGS